MDTVIGGAVAPGKTRKIAFVFISMPVGGAEDFALAVARHLAPEFEPHFVCLRELGKLGEEARASGLNVHLAPFFPSKIVNPLNIRRFAAWLRREDIALVHSQTHHAHIFATRAARLAGIPSVVHQQKTLEKLPWRRRRIFGACLRRASRVVALSAQTAHDLQDAFALPSDKLAVVPNAIDKTVFRPASDRMEVRRSLGLPPEGLLLGTVARLHPDKNHTVIIEALGLLAARGQRAAAVFVGEGPLRGELEAMAQARGVGEHVIFAGRQRPVAPWFQAMDYFVLPSTWEGQPLALLQALCCRVPVLASRIEGNTAVLGEDDPGLFAPADAAALAALLAEAVGSDDLRRRLLERQASVPVPGSDGAAALLRPIYHSLVR